MTPTLALLVRLQIVFRTYIMSQLTAPGWNLVLLKAAFTPSKDLVIGDVTLDPEMGAFPLAITDSVHFTGRDPATGDLVIWLAAGAGVELLMSSDATPRQEFGWAIVETGTFAIIASKLMPAPQQVSSTDDGILNPEIGFHLPMNLMR